MDPSCTAYAFRSLPRNLAMGVVRGVSARPKPGHKPRPLRKSIALGLAYARKSPGPECQQAATESPATARRRLTATKTNESAVKMTASVGNKGGGGLLLPPAAG